MAGASHLLQVLRPNCHAIAKQQKAPELSKAMSTDKSDLGAEVSAWFGKTSQAGPPLRRFSCVSSE